MTICHARFSHLDLIDFSKNRVGHFNQIQTAGNTTNYVFAFRRESFPTDSTERVLEICGSDCQRQTAIVANEFFDCALHRELPFESAVDNESMSSRMSRARQQVVWAPNLTGLGNLPSRTPAHQLLLEIGSRTKTCRSRRSEAGSTVDRNRFPGELG